MSQATPSKEQPPLVLIVDDDRGLVRLIEKALLREGFRTTCADSGREALRSLGEQPPALMLLDLKLPDVQATQLIEQLTQAGRCPPFIVITGQGDERVAVDMMKRGARDYLIKDVDFLQFVPAVVKRAFERLKQERRLSEAEAQVHLVRSAIEHGFSAVLITDADLPDPRVVYINPTFAQVTGYAPEHILGKPLSSLSKLRTVQQRLREGVPEGLPVIEQISSYSSPQGERLGEWRVGPVKNKEGKNTHWLIIFRDITERKRLEREILEISDQERRRIGQDLHDGLCQHLAGIELMSQVLEQKLAARSKADATRAGEIARHVREAISQTRSLARGLSPVTLESEGLATGLQELATNTEKMFGVSCRVECPLPVKVEAMSAATHLYRIAQEAVSNAIKHGKASEIRIRLEPEGSRIRLSVLDNGAGFSKKPSSKDGMGLHIMRYRAGMLGGILTIEQNPVGGTRVVCVVPQNSNSPQPEMVSI
jgi:PAS domain S-box-containing protein